MRKGGTRFISGCKRANVSSLVIIKAIRIRSVLDDGILVQGVVLIGDGLAKGTM
ncbi:DUF3927 domain-containing protein [Geobacillus kaustophilus NBRC 102445]|nr:DUF3927 domain-containing protein [Geobacillus kaustophilus NBRC 102445]